MNKTIFTSIAIITAVSLAACTSPTSPVATPVETGSVVQSGTTAVTLALRGLGTEPFRGFTVEGNTIERRTPTDEGTVQKNTFVGVTQSQQDDDETVLYQDSHNKILITATKGQCSDGMSDTIYPYTVTVDYDNQSFSGCAELEE